MAKSAAKINITDDTALAYFCGVLAGELVADIPQPLVRVRYREDLTEVYARINAALPIGGRLFLDPVPAQTVEVTMAPSEAVSSHDMLLGALDHVAPAESDIHMGAQQLLESDSPAVTLQALYTAHMAGGVPQQGG